MSDYTKLTATFWKSLLRHEGAIFQSAFGLQTVRINGKYIEGGHHDLRKYIYEHILTLKKSDIETCEQNLKARISYEEKKRGTTTSEPVELGSAYDTFDDINHGDLDKFYERFEPKEEDLKEEIKSERLGLNSIDISKIELIKIDENARMETKIFPKSYLCPVCDYYIIFSDDYPGDLLCPDCKEKNKKVRLNQNNFVSVCPICAKIVQIAPFWEFDQKGLKLGSKNNPFNCLDSKCNGKIKLRLNEKYLGASYWHCSQCTLSYKKFIPGSSHEHKVINYHHECKIYDRAGTPLAVKYMFNRNSARLLNPLIFEYITISNKEVNFKTLKEGFSKAKTESKRTWELNNLEQYYLSIFKDTYNIEDVFLVGGFKIQTCCFGYESNNQDEKYLKFKRRQFFRDATKGIYKVFFFENEGNALVIKLNKSEIIKKLVEALGLKVPEDDVEFYDLLILKFFERLNNTPIQDFLKSDDPEVKLFKSIHFFSHVILNGIVKKIGIDVFRIKLLLKDAVIFIYEIDRVLSGGLNQLTLNEGSENTFFSLFCYEILPKIKECNNLCEDHCQKCSFINDFYCRPLIYYENTKKKWFPPNSLVSRDMAKKIILK